jgi:uncharacterized repeat protein (TIGR01451 family)
MTNQKLKVPIGTRITTMLAAIVGFWLFSAMSTVWAYDAKICLIDMFNQPISGLSVTTGSNSATTDGSGCATIDGLAEGSYTLTIATAGYKAFSQDFSVGSNHKSHDLKTHHAIKSTDGYRIQGTVVDSSYTALSGVTVSANSTQVSTDASGQFGLNFSEAGSYTLSFEKSGYPTVTRSYAVSDSSPLKSTGSVRLSIGYVQVRFINMFGQTVSDLTVTAGGKTATLSDNGYYVIEGLSSGSYTLSMTHAEYNAFSSDFSLSASSPSRSFGNVYLIKTTDGYRIQGRVIDASNAALSGVTVSADGKQATTDANGEFGINFSSANSYTLTFEKSGYLSVSNSYSVSDSSPLTSTGNVRVISGYTVTGTVLDINKQPLAGVLVEVAGQSATTGDDGVYTVTGILTHGTQTLKLSQGGNTISRSISISSSQPVYSMYSLYLVDSYMVYGAVYDVRNQPMASIRVEAGGNSAVTDAEGLYQILVSETGKHTVTVKQAGYKEVSKTSNSVSDTSPNGEVGNLYAISLTEGYNITGTVKLVDPSVDFSKVSVAVGDLSTTPDSNGNFLMKGLVTEGSHTLTVNIASDGYRTMSRGFSVYDSRPYLALGTMSFGPNLSMAMNTSSTKIELGGTMEYTVNITNSGYGPANQVEMYSSQPLPDGVRFISAEVIGSKLPNYNTPADGGIENNCNITPETKILNCKYLGSLGGGQTTQMKVVVGFNATTTQVGGSGGSGSGGISGSITVGQPFSLSFGATGIACLDCNSDEVPQIQAPPPPPRPLPVEHFLTMALSGGTSQLEIGNSLSYQVTVRNSQTAPTAITNTNLTITLPELVELSSVTPTQGRCNSSAGTTLNCNLDTLVSDTQVSIKLDMKAAFVGLGKVNVALTSDQAPTIEKSSSNFSIIPPPLNIEEDLEDVVVGEIVVGLGDADLALVIDDTGSMGEEIQALIAAISEFIPTLSARGASAPTVSLYTFKDDVTHRITTQSLSSLLSRVRSLHADYGDDCPEASLAALKEALPKLNIGGRMILVTDASSHTDVNVDDLITALRAKGVRVDVILSGDDCVGVCQVANADEGSVGAIEVFSRIAEETGGLFATPFEVNAGTTSGATKYHKVALNVMLSTVSPSITSVMPSAVPQGTTIDLSLIAANTSFNGNSEVSFGDGVTVNAVEVLSSSKITLNVTISDTASVNFRDVTVTTPQGDAVETAKGLGVLEVLETFEQPQILGITPSMVARNGTATVTITGVNTDFSNSSQLSFGDGITVQNVTANSQTTLTAELSVSNSATQGLHKAMITTGGAVVTNACSAEISPATGSLLVTPSLDESAVPRIIEVTPNKGAQGAIRKLELTAVNTHFVQDVSELSFGKQGLYVLELTVLSETELSALVQIDPEAEIGFWDVFVYTDNEFASLLEGFEVTTKGPYTVEGCVYDKTDQPLANIELDTGNQLGFTDESGCYSITGLWEGEYEMTLTSSEKDLEPVPFIVSPNTSTGDDGGIVRLDIAAYASALVVEVKRDLVVVYQGDTLTYTITVTNYGEMMATGITLTDQLPEGASLVSADILEGGNCTANDEQNSVTCGLPDLAKNRSATVKIKAQVDQITRQTVLNTVTLNSNEYPAEVMKTWNTFRPYLSVYIKDDRDPIQPNQTLHYTIDVELSHYASQSATGVTLVSYLPDGVELKSVQTEYGSCDTSAFPKITCEIVDLDVSTADSISHITVGISVILRDPGLLLLVHEAQVTANEYPMNFNRERTEVDIGEGFVDMVFLVDETGSMQQEINGVIKAIRQLVDELDGTTAPWLALVSFKDEVVLKAATQNLDLFEQALMSLEAEGGGTCPEAAIEALSIAIPHVKSGGTIFLATDASPYEDADVEGVIESLRDSGIRFNPVVTGDCSEQDSWNQLP